MLATTLADEIRRRLGPVPELSSPPLISIIVLNRDGVGHLRRLLAGLTERTDYPHLELILVDNGSTDDSLEFIRSVEAPFPISIIANPHNESFSDANNQGAELASGELLLFLNNDIEPFEPGWLRELLVRHQESSAGVVGATLINPRESAHFNHRVESPRLRLREDGYRLGLDWSDSPRELFGDSFGEDIDSLFGSGACLLMDARLFRLVGGFTHGYFYGGEDVDLVLKLREQGRGFRYSGRSLLFHRTSSSTGPLIGQDPTLARRNRQIFDHLWGPRVWREYHLDRLAGAHLWSGPQQEDPTDSPSLEEVVQLGICVKADGLDGEHDRLVQELEAELGRRRRRRLVLRGSASDDPRSYLYDAVVHVRGARRYSPAPSQLNVLWALDNGETLTPIECKRYDLVLLADAGQAARMSLDSGEMPPVVVVYAAWQAQSVVEAILAHVERLGLPARIEPVPLPGAGVADARR